MATATDSTVAGSGNAAARRGARVTATDVVPQLLEVAARRAAIEGLLVDTEEADAQALPFPDGAFDVVLSTFGVRFAADQARAASELVTVCRPAGLLGSGMADLKAQVLTTDMCAASPAARVEFNRAYVGPTKAIFDRLDPPGNRPSQTNWPPARAPVEPRHRRDTRRLRGIPPDHRRKGTLTAAIACRRTAARLQITSSAQFERFIEEWGRPAEASTLPEPSPPDIDACSPPPSGMATSTSAHR